MDFPATKLSQIYQFLEQYGEGKAVSYTHLGPLTTKNWKMKIWMESLCGILYERR